MLTHANAVTLVSMAIAVEEVSAIKLTKSELADVADDLDAYIGGAGDQNNDWCVLDEMEIIKAHFAVKKRHGSKIAKQCFMKHLELFQDVTHKIQMVAAMVDIGKLEDGGKAFFEATKQMCVALKEYTLSLLDAMTVNALDDAFEMLKRVYDDIFVVEFDLVVPNKLPIGSSSSQSVSSVFGVIKWVIRYWTMLYIIGAMLYNVYHYSELFKGGETVLDFCMNTFGCICMAFVGSSYAITQVMNHALRVVGSIISSSCPLKSDSALGGVLRYLGTAFLSGWIVSVSRCVCLIVTQASRMKYPGFKGAVWDGIQQVGWKAWSSISEAMIWVNGVVADNGRDLLSWFVKFTNDMVWKRFMSGITAFIGHATGVDVSSVSTASVSITLAKKSTSTLTRMIPKELVVQAETHVIGSIDTFTDFMSELKYTTINGDMTGVAQTLAIQDLTEILEAKPPKVGYVRGLINKGITTITSVMMLVLIIMMTQLMLLRGV
jgi:hypothetical protein